MVFNLITENRAGISLYMKACSGNTQHIKSLKSVYKNTYLIGDAALYTKETIQALSSANQLFITRVPQKIKEAKQVDWVALNDGSRGHCIDSEYGKSKRRTYFK